jgi:predicted DNA-binding protein
MAQLTNQDDFIKTALRLPRELHARVQEAATAAGRSMNAEIVARLEASFDVSEDLVAKFDQLMDIRQERLLEELRTTVQKMLGKDEPADKKR